MLFESTIYYDLEGLSADFGPSIGPVPLVDYVLKNSAKHLNVYRPSEDTIIIATLYGWSFYKQYVGIIFRRAYWALLRRLGNFEFSYRLQVRLQQGDPLPLVHKHKPDYRCYKKMLRQSNQRPHGLWVGCFPLIHQVLYGYSSYSNVPVRSLLSCFLQLFAIV